MYSAFGNEDLFNSIAYQFVNNSNASFSCKSWVMKASQQHVEDVYYLNTVFSGQSAQTRAGAINEFQGKMVNMLFPALNKACNP